MGAETVTFDNSRGLRLVGDLYRASATHIVILSHGFTSDKQSRGRFPRLATALNNAGYSVLAFDFAGCGHSDDDTLHPDKLLDDLRSAIRFVQMHDFERIALYGHSLGTTISLRAYSSAIETMVLSGAGTGAIEYDWSEHYSREQLHELSTTGLLTTKAGGEVQRSVVIQAALLDHFDSIDARTLLSPVKCPVLLIHGGDEEDWEEQMLLERSRDGLKYLSPNSRLEVIAGATHSFTDHYDEVIRLTLEWLAEWMPIE